MSTLDQELLGQVRGEEATEPEEPVHSRVDEWVTSLTAQIEAELDQLHAERNDAQKRVKEIDTEINRLKRILRASGPTVYAKKKAKTYYSVASWRKDKILEVMRGHGAPMTNRAIHEVLGSDWARATINAATLRLRQEKKVVYAGNAGQAQLFKLTPDEGVTA